MVVLWPKELVISFFNFTNKGKLLYLFVRIVDYQRPRQDIV
jgi:hypothetical protein